MKGIKESYHDKAESQVEVHFVGQIEGSKFGFDNSYIHWFSHLHFRYNNNNTIKKKKRHTESTRKEVLAGLLYVLLNLWLIIFSNNNNNHYL